MSTSSSVPVDDIAHFRAWLRENHPLASPESRFLDDDEDLISLNLKEETPLVSAPLSQPRGGGVTLDFLPLCILMTTVFPLLCFKFITSVLNRLILLTVLLAAGLSGLEKLDRSKGELHPQWLIACFGVSFLVAVFF